MTTVPAVDRSARMLKEDVPSPSLYRFVPELINMIVYVFDSVGVLITILASFML